MAAPTTAVQPAERQDIHKSCRTIETLLAALNDYCEAASAFAAIQKRLSKTLRDAAALKTNARFAANAFGASSIILEVLADVDSKFAKIAEKESHSLSSEVKKWFKKLARVEKAHDERMSDSNARIKQAGQAYERKSKKGGKDAGEEHARYVNLLSVIGPEMSQEKHNHTVHVSQQNALVTFNVAASLSRIADAEWTRACECMRRISPTIGPLGEWRSLCEGAWTGSLPDDLPEASSETSVAPAVSEWGQTGLSTPVRRLLPVPPATNYSPSSVSTPAATSLDPPRSPFSATAQNQGSINSITTLSAFPFPPTHIPLPPTVNEAELQPEQTQLLNIQYAHSRSSSPNPTQSRGAIVPLASIVADAMAVAALSDSLVSDVSRSSQVSQIPSTSHQSPTDARAPEASPRPAPLILSHEDKESLQLIVSGGDPKKPRRPSSITRVPPPSDKSIRPISPFKRAEYTLTENEFGVHTNSSRAPIKSHSVDAAKKNLERTDSTHSAGSNVAALRNRYTQTAETPSQGPKDIPRLPMSVSEMASRYQPVDEPLSPRRATSPTVDCFPPDTPARTSPRDIPFDESEARRRKQRIEELAELESKEKEHGPRQRERELYQPSRDFERGRLQFLRSRTPEPGNAADGPRGPRESNRPFQHKRGSRSVTHVNSPLSTNTTTMTSSSGISDSPSRSPHLPSKDHAPFCGCDGCSVSKYKTTDASPASPDLRPPVPPILLRPEKPRGWIRRLSMPSVNAAFSLDAKKNGGALSLKAGLPLPGENGRLRKRSFERGVGNRTVTEIGR